MSVILQSTCSPILPGCTLLDGYGGFMDDGYYSDGVNWALVTGGQGLITSYGSCTTIPPIVECLDGLIIETIYLDELTDVDLLPLGYEHPCPGEIGAHGCNRALFEIYGNGVYIGDSKLNNAFGALSGPVTAQGTYICGDYGNTPDLLTGGTWTGSADARYNKHIITAQQALDIAAAGGGGTVISFALNAAMTTYGTSCDGSPIPHTNTTWVRASLNSGAVVYNGCPDGNVASIDVCAPIGPTTTTSTTTTTTLAPGDVTYTGFFELVVDPTSEKAFRALDVSITGGHFPVTNVAIGGSSGTINVSGIINTGDKALKIGVPPNPTPMVIAEIVSNSVGVVTSNATISTDTSSGYLKLIVTPNTAPSTVQLSGTLTVKYIAPVTTTSTTTTSTTTTTTTTLDTSLVAEIKVYPGLDNLDSSKYTAFAQVMTFYNGNTSTLDTLNFSLNVLNTGIFKYSNTNCGTLVGGQQGFTGSLLAGSTSGANNRFTPSVSKTGVASIKFRGVSINSTLFTSSGILTVGANKYIITYIDTCFNT
jgi:hypothetical protein